MNAEECARLVGTVRSLYPAQRFDENPESVVNAWGLVVADVDYDEARAAVVKLARRGQAWVSPGDVRREVAATRNVLAPDVDALLFDVREVARLQGVGRRALHPVARRVYDSVGGQLMISRMDSRGLQTLRRQLEEVAGKFDAHVLDDVLPPPAPTHAAITGREDLHALTSPTVDEDLKPLDPDRADRLRGFIEGSPS